MTIPVRFVAVAGDAALRCGAPVSTPRGLLELRDFRVFISDIEWITTDGTYVPAVPENGAGQDARVVLLDFEDASGECEGDIPLRTEIVLESAAVTVAGIRFTIGVPFAANHQNPALALPPLTAGSLHWGWRAGYKFLKLEARLGDAEARVHIGSTECHGELPVITGCDRPNRPVVRLDGFGPASDTIELDALTIISAGKDVDCMGDADDAGCATAFQALGLAPGAPLRASFRVRR